MAIRFDHRDTGLSTFVDFERDPYELMDLVTNALTILDRLGAQRAQIWDALARHVVRLVTETRKPRRNESP